MGRSHSYLGKSKGALALFSQASKLASTAAASTSLSAAEEGAPRVDVPRTQAQTLATTLRDLVAQYRGLVTLETMSTEHASKSASERPAIEQLHEYAGDGLDLSHLTPVLPRLQPVPVKPLFLDVAWNYIDYPREGGTQAPGTSEPPAEEQKSTRRGWFGFGR